MPGATAGPFAHLTREQLEKALEGALEILGGAWKVAGAVLVPTYAPNTRNETQTIADK